ncbi:MAG: bifunctional demethylmenaquinone methyltransferase/2-methoxy-6-polyprenyl-1,4-benzoquinol methylase UbiE [Deltaproteobacteria bacterium]|nr:bifunctional demethylmenaquinone methyltransferase/2-methoxy-6-polyprenyl-1,4-benzoquinol methylase UbiE [Deltaproteobacteria bacterium]
MKKRTGKRYESVTDITQTEHIKMVKEIFTTITEKYDFLNHFLSFGRDIVWRRFTASKMNFIQNRRYLDVATGTADLAIEVARKYPQTNIIALDFVRDMMNVGRHKSHKYDFSKRIKFLQGDALKLPFSDYSFDVVGIAFGIRNITDRARALREMKRVLVNGGQCMVLEMNFPRNSLFRGMYNLYLNHILPYLARHFSQNPAAYHYLADSIIHFPSPAEFMNIMKEAGFTNIERHSLTMGITCLYIGSKPDNGG